MNEELKGEAVEVVGWVSRKEQGRSVRQQVTAYKPVHVDRFKDQWVVTDELMTVAQHQRLMAAKDAEIALLNEIISHVRMQASIQAQEARTQKSIVSEIGAMVGCDDDFLTAGAVRDALAQHSAPAERGVVEALVSVLEKIVHDERVPNEVSQEFAEALIYANRLNPAPSHAAKLVGVPVELLERILEAEETARDDPLGLHYACEKLRALLATDTAQQREGQDHAGQ